MSKKVELLKGMYLDDMPTPLTGENKGKQHTQEISFHSVIGVAIGDAGDFLNIVAVAANGDRLEVTFFRKNANTPIEIKQIGEIEYSGNTHRAAAEIYDATLPPKRCKECDQELPKCKA